MSGGLDEPGGQDSDGTVVGRERLVKGCHDAPDCRGSFDQINTKSPISQIHGCLYAGDAASHDHDGADHVMIVIDTIHVATLRDYRINGLRD